MADESALDDRWLSVEEISQYLGVKRDTIYKWLENRQMPAHKVGRLWKFQKREIDLWVKSGKSNSNTHKF
ncbi:MAG: helix-turn-helix domain-containing protein [Parachlamydiaceae bacterium]